MMSAIDLLLTAGRNSERLHQLVLKVLFTRTPLLARLTRHAFATKEVHWEPEGRAFDLLVEGTGGEKVRIEIKVDSELSKAQILRQVAAHEAEKGLDFIYLLIGTSEIAHGERWGQWPRILSKEPRPPLYDGHKLRQAVLAAVDEHTPQDVRDLAHAYAHMLAELATRTRGFAGKPVADFTADDYLGFFDELRIVENFGGGSTVAPVEAIGRTFVACAWAGHDAKEWSLYMQFENDRLCLKLHPHNKDLPAPRRLKLRERAVKTLDRVAKQAGVALELTEEKAGKHMTLARFPTVKILSADPHDAALRKLLRNVHAVVKRTGETLEASG